MSTITGKGGFFSPTGSLSADALRSSGHDDWQASRNASGSAEPSSVSAQSASTTYSALAEAAVVSISAKMNVGNTGFDSQARSLVESALAKRASLQGTSPASSSDGTVSPPSAPASPDASSENDEVRELAEKYVQQHETQTGRALSEEERKQKIDDVTRYYSEGNRAQRLQTLLDETA